MRRGARLQQRRRPPGRPRAIPAAARVPPRQLRRPASSAAPPAPPNPSACSGSSSGADPHPGAQPNSATAESTRREARRSTGDGRAEAEVDVGGGGAAARHAEARRRQVAHHPEGPRVQPRPLLPLQHRPQVFDCCFSTDGAPHWRDKKI